MALSITTITSTPFSMLPSTVGMPHMLAYSSPSLTLASAVAAASKPKGGRAYGCLNKVQRPSTPTYNTHPE